MKKIWINSPGEPEGLGEHYDHRTDATKEVSFVPEDEALDDSLGTTRIVQQVKSCLNKRSTNE